MTHASVPPLPSGSTGTGSAPALRLLFIDNLRWLMIVFVVAVHAAVTYSNLGSWYYTEPRELDRGSLLFFAMMESFLQAFFMGFLFLIAGYFAPGAFDRKGPRRFLIDRFIRLGIPTLIYVLFIHPFNVYQLLRFQRVNPGRSFWTSWALYVTSPSVLRGTGPLWFALALLIFSIVYALIRMASSKPLPSPRSKIPGNSDLILLASEISIFAFAIRLVQPIGTNFFNMQLCFFAQYIVLFATGIYAWRHNWLILLPCSLGLSWFRLALIGGTLGWLALILCGGRNPMVYTGGWSWTSAGYALWESFFCVGICAGLIVLFREKYNHQGRFEKFLSANAFSVYVFHAPAVIALALALRPWHAPPLLKFAALTISSLVVAFVGCHLLIRRIPGLNRIL